MSNNAYLTFKTKNNKDAIIRESKPQDTKEVLNIIHKATQETGFLLLDKKDIESLDFEYEELCAYMYSNEDDDIELVCEIDKQLVGTIKIIFNSEIKLKHRAKISLCILKDYWNLGIGKAFIYQAIKLAKENNIEQLELKYIEGNKRARNLYNKIGFIEYGTIPRAVKIPDGTYKNEILMLKEL